MGVRLLYVGMWTLALDFHVVTYSESLDRGNREVEESRLVVNLVDFGSEFGSCLR